MDHLSQFMSHHVLLCLGFALSLLVVFMVEARLAKGGNHALTPQGVTQAINREDAVVIDIRDVDAFRDGHIIGSINVPSTQWEAQEKRLEKYKTKPIVIIDAMGQKAQTYQAKLTKSGFEQVKMLTGGINAWRSASLPLVKGSK